MSTSGEMTQLFSRARPLFYFLMWYEADKEGIRRFLGDEIAGALFIVRPSGENAEVWYSKSELDRLSNLAFEQLAASEEKRRALIASWEDGWEELKEYFDGTKRITSSAELDEYFARLTAYWAGMNTVFFLIADDPRMPADVTEAMVRIREKTQEHTDEMSTLYNEFFARAFPGHADLGIYATLEDVRALEKGAAGTIATLEARAKEGCYLLDGRFGPLPELDAELMRRGLSFEKRDVLLEESITEISGKTAQKGKVTGRVRLALSPADARATLEGEILVAPMTTPDYIDAMHRAAAFVTDEGGIVCHAAVTAREMGKPCVIGTKVASRVLKTGDMVIVDADAGIVRKI